MREKALPESLSELETCPPQSASINVIDKSGDNALSISHNSPSSHERNPFLADSANAEQDRSFSKAAVSFFALVLLHVLLAMSFRFAQRKPSGDYPFSSPALLVVAEFTKLVISSSLFWQEECCRRARYVIDGPSQLTPAYLACLTCGRLRSELSIRLVRDTGFLAALYCINNNITFIVFRMADGANINLIKSGSSFVSALMLRFALGRGISRIQWSAILLQISGLLISQFGTTCSDAPVLPPHAYLLLFLSLVMSSVCGVWNDSMLKDHNGASMHSINIMLYAYGLMMNGVAYVYIVDQTKLFFSGFDQLSTYLVLVCQSLFGITISAVYKYSDATTKAFALSCATSVLMFINVLAFGMPFSLVASMGCFTVFVATHLYVGNPPQASIRITDAEA